MDKKSPFINIMKNNKEVEEEVTTDNEKTKNLKEKTSDFLSKKAQNIKEVSKIEKDEDYKEVKEEVKTSTHSNVIFLLLGPIIGFVTGPALFLFAIDIEEEQFAIMKIALLGNAIGLFLTMIIAYTVFKDGIRKTTLSVFRHFFTKGKISDIKHEQLVEKNEELKIKNEELTSEVKRLNEDLYEYNIEKEIKKRANKKEAD
jgi:uncharacterized protein YacL